MQHNSKRKRLQFSSCDACRQSRVSCDASKQGHEPSAVSWRGSCSRCLRRERPCTFEWIRDTNKSDSEIKTVADSFIFYEPVKEAHPLIPSTGVFMKWCDDLFLSGFEIIFGLLAGRYGCPFVKADATCYISILTTQLFWELDAHLEEAPESQSTVQAVDPVDHRLKINDQIGVTLSCAMHAYAAQWLPLVSQAYDLPFSHVQDIITERWRAARKAMLKAINRPTYRSMLALYLFAQTPMPVGISEDEESDGLSGAVCMQTALSQLQQLRAQRTTGQLDNSISTLASSDIPPQYIDYENRAYWTAMIWETSISLTSNSRTFLTSGLRGACSEPTWRLVKAFLVGSFIPRTLQWHNVDLEVTHDVANEIISVASISKTYIWKNISSVKEALREGVHDDGVLFAWKALLEAIGIFSTSIRPLLGTCQRQLQQLDQSVRLMWYQTYLQYHLGILFLVDALEAAARSDLLEEIGAIKLNAENECFNILRFGLNNTYTVEISSTADRNNSFPGQIVTASLVAIDPCPQHVIDCVHLMHKVVCRRFNQKATTHENYIREMSDLRKILGQLPQSSKSVQKALTLEFLGTA